METTKVSSVQNQNFTSKLKQETKEKKAPEETKDGKKKLALALGGLAAVGATTFALYKTGKLNGIIDSLKQLKNKNQLDGFKNKDSIGNTIKPNLSKPKVDTVIGDTSIIKPTKPAPANNLSPSIDIKPQAKEASIADELKLRNEAKQKIEHARKTQDELIEVMQNPSGMSKAEKQELVDSLEENLNKKSKLIPKKPDVQQINNAEKPSVTTSSTQTEKKVKRNTKTKRTYNYKDKKNGYEEIVEIKGKGDLKDSGSFNQVHCEWKTPVLFGDEPVSIDAVKSPLPYWDAYDNISYTQGNKRYTQGIYNDDKKLKIKQPNGKFKTIMRESPEKLVAHLEDGTTQVLNKSNGTITVYDKKGKIIDTFYRTDTERPKVAIALTNSGREVEEIIPGETNKYRTSNR